MENTNPLMSGLEQLYNLWKDYQKWQFTHPANEDITFKWLTDLIPDTEHARDYLWVFNLSDDQRAQFEFLFGNLPLYGQLLDIRDNWNYMSDYLKNSGIDWADIKYIARTVGSGKGSDALNYLSRNIEKFYHLERGCF